MAGLIKQFQDIDTLSPGDFEIFVKNVFEAAGWTDAVITAVGKEYKHGDGGVDIFAYKGKRRFAIEVKQRNISTTVEVSALNQLVTGARLAGVNQMILVTNSYFTSEVRIRAFKLGVELIDRDALKSLWELKHSEIGREIKPRSYQKLIIDEFIEKYKTGKCKFLIEMATGLGKTYTAAQITKEIFSLAGSHIKVLFIAHQVEILLQSFTSFKNVLGLGNYSYSACFSGSDPEDTDIVFATFDTLYGKLNDLKRNEFHLIIVDEAHHVPAKTYAEVVSHFDPNILIGLTATPERMDTKDVYKFFGGGDGHIGRYDLAWGLKNNKLAFPKYHVLLHDLDQSRINHLEQGLTVDDLDKTLFLHKKDEEVIRIIEKTIVEKEIQNPKGIVFCNSIGHMNHLIKFFELGSATLVHSRMSDMERRNNIRSFREGSYKFILVCDLFNEGIDIPETNILVFMRYTGSRTIWLQQLGRGLRKTANKEYVHVLDFVGSLDRLADLASLKRSIDNSETIQIEQDDTDFITPKEKSADSIVHDSTLEVSYSESAAQVLKLIEDLEYRLNNRANLLDLIRNYHSINFIIPSIDAFEKSIPEVTLDQISTHFDSYNRYLTLAFGDLIDDSHAFTKVKRAYDDFVMKTSIAPSPKALVAHFKYKSLEEFTLGEISQYMADIGEQPCLGQAPAINIETLSSQAEDYVKNVDEDLLLERYKQIILTIDDYRALSMSQKAEIRSVFPSSFLFLQKLGIN